MLNTTTIPLHACMQDIVTRFATSTGHHVIRRFGWDCHGLPVEYEIDKKLSECASEGLPLVRVTEGTLRDGSGLADLPVPGRRRCNHRQITRPCPLFRWLMLMSHALPPAARSTADIKSRDDVLSMGIGAYNEECRSIVMR